MANMMCAVQVTYGAFTDYFVPANIVIRLLEHIAMDSTDAATPQLPMPLDRLRAFLALSDDAAVVRAREVGLDLRDVAEPDGGWDPLWGRVSDFLTWFRNMQRMLQAGEFEPFVDCAKTITFDFS